MAWIQRIWVRNIYWLPKTAGATNAPAESAAATGTAYNASVTVAPNAGTATASGVTDNPNAGVKPNAGTATGTGTADNPFTHIKPNAGTATATGTAYGAIFGRFATAASANGRYLVDQSSEPWMANGLSPQLVQKLTTTEMDDLIADMVALGLNASLSIGTTINAWGVNSTGQNANGDTPWPSSGSSNTITTPDDAYWDHIEAWVDKCAVAGITVVLNLVDNINWGSTFSGKSDANCRTFGQEMGTRFASKSNIIWCFGVDWLAAQWSGLNSKYGSILRGLRDSGANQIFTLWLNYESSHSTENTDWDGTTDRGGYVWELPDVNFGYSYYSSEMRIKEAYNDVAIPVGLFESYYWDEHSLVIGGVTTTTRKSVRKQNGRAITYGGLVGAFPSSDDIWQCNDPDNLTDLAEPVFADVARLVAHIAGLDGWHLLEPDYDQSFITSGNDAEPTLDSTDADLHDYITASVASDGSLALLYVSEGTFTVDLTELTGTPTHYWFDPSSGDTTAATTGQPTYPGNNDGGDSDWLLVFLGGAETNADAGHASGTGTAFNASVTVAPNAGTATSTGTANAASETVAPNAGTATAAGVVTQAAASIAVNAGTAAATGTANNATVSTSAGTNVNAEAAAGTGTAYNATITISFTAGTCTATGTANQPAGAISAQAGTATASSTAGAAAAAIYVAAAVATATGEAINATGPTPLIPVLIQLVSKGRRPGIVRRNRPGVQ